MNVAYVTTWDPHDPGLWAGTGYHIGRALEAQGCKVDYIGPLKEQFALPVKAAQFMARALLGRELQRDREPIILRGYAKQIQKRLEKSEAQVVLSAGGVATRNVSESPSASLAARRTSAVESSASVTVWPVATGVAPFAAIVKATDAGF